MVCRVVRCWNASEEDRAFLHVLVIWRRPINSCGIVGWRKMGVGQVSVTGLVVFCLGLEECPPAHPLHGFDLPSWVNTDKCSPKEAPWGQNFPVGFSGHHVCTISPSHWMLGSWIDIERLYPTYHRWGTSKEEPITVTACLWAFLVTVVSRMFH